jgi:hypothetical protein
VRRLLRRRGVKPALLVAFVALVVAVQVLPSARHDEVVQRLEEKYGAQEIVWQGNGRYQRDTLVVDGKDVSDECVVTGDWGPLDDLAIECDGHVAFVPVDQ